MSNVAKVNVNCLNVSLTLEDIPVQILAELIQLINPVSNPGTTVLESTTDLNSNNSIKPRLSDQALGLLKKVA